MLISHVIPAYNASKSIEKTLDSVFDATPPGDWSVEAIVVDDGSKDSDELAKIVEKYHNAKLVVHKTNRGMCAGRNTGIAESKGDIVTILDSDDELVKNWFSVLEEIVQEWPPELDVCYAACQNPEGRITATNPEYHGLLTLNDLLNERHAGEYIPLFRGEFVRKNPYIDLSLRKSCGIVSYINFALDNPFWITNRVFRIYNDTRSGSVTSNWMSQKNAAETVRCYQILFKKFGNLYKIEAPGVFKSKQLKLAVYMKLARMKGYLKIFKSGFSLTRFIESCGVFLLLLLPISLMTRVLVFLKNVGLLRRYG